MAACIAAGGHFEIWQQAGERSHQAGPSLLASYAAAQGSMTAGEVGWLLLQVRGKGLFIALVIKPQGGVTAWEVCLALKDRGLLAKPTHGDIIRLAPPLCITEQQVMDASAIIQDALLSFDK